MTGHYRWETTLDQRRRADPGIDDPARRAAARNIEKMQVESVAAYVAAIGGHLRLVADFDQATTTFIDYTDALTA